jgi:methyl-accepting chemotaxis protein
MVRFLSRLRISHKLLLISLAYMLPIGTLVYHLLQSNQANIDFAVWEQYGDQYQRPLQEILNGLTDYRVALAQNSVDNADVMARIDASMDKLAAVQTVRGDDLKFTPEELAKRDRAHLHPQTVQKEWSELKSALHTSDAAAISAKVVHLIADTRGMIAHMGDTSNLILDPDLDSYYLMDITLLALPQNQDRLAEVVEYGIAALNEGKEISEEQRLTFGTYAALLKQSDLDRINGDFGTSLKEDQNFYGVSDSYQSSIPPLLESYSTAMNTLIAQLIAISQGKSLPTVTEFIEVGNRARVESTKLWERSVDELDTLLGVRIHHFELARFWELTPALCALVLTLMLVFFVTRSITKPLGAIIAELSTLTENLTRGASQLSGTSEGLAQGTTEQAASLQETATSIDSISTALKRPKKLPSY